jgi:hypothetical protein
MLGDVALSGLQAFILESSASKIRFQHIIEKAKREHWQALPIGERVVAVAREFVGTPYVAGTLEGSVATKFQERCTADLMSFDCVTLFETALCMARVLKKNENPAFEDLLVELTTTRYRGGVLTDYTSRLHYTSEWFADNERKGIVENITRDNKRLGGIQTTLAVGFMSAHPALYPALKASPELISIIQSVEQNINAIEKYVIPLASIHTSETMLQTGDIAGIATTKAGLDYTHTGLVVREQQDKASGTARLLHASLKHKKVMLDSRLSHFVMAHPSARGITVVRPLER